MTTTELRKLVADLLNVAEEIEAFGGEPSRRYAERYDDSIGRLRELSKQVQAAGFEMDEVGNWRDAIAASPSEPGEMSPEDAVREGRGG